MKIDGLKIPKSSFLSMEKDTNLIINKMLENERLKRLLYYTDKHALERANLNEDQTLELIGNNIKIVPKLTVDSSVLNYVIINFDKFIPTENPEFRDNTIEFDIICHFDQWQLKDFALRPYKIAAEIDSMFNNTHLTGIGELRFIGATQIILTDEFAGLCLLYEATHGGEDKKGMPNPKDEARFIDDFKKMVGK
jgi:hypothetical protein